MAVYEKTGLQAFGAQFADLVYALADGLDPDDAGAAVSLLTSAAGCLDEITGDTDAAVLDILAGAASRVSDLRRDAEWEAVE